MGSVRGDPYDGIVASGGVLDLDSRGIQSKLFTENLRLTASVRDRPHPF
jgi:hypothetical protein